MNKDKIILDLCGGTGSWSAPYKKAGYDVRLITLPDYDVLTYEPPENVYGVLAAPPCTDFSIAGAHLWKDKDESGKTIESLKVVKRCFEIAEIVKPKFFALENPRGRLHFYIGNPYMSYNYKDFGCPYSKTVCLWGFFNVFMPVYIGIQEKNFKMADGILSELPIGYDWKGAGMSKRAAQRSITYSGFAEAFFLANQ